MKTTWGAIAAAGLAATLFAQEVPTFRADVEYVHLDVFVSRDGTPVTGLSAEDFDVRDQGVRQQVELLLREHAPLNAILALDTSESVAGERLKELRRAAHAFVNRLDAADRVTLVTFDHRVRRPATGRADRRRLHDAINAAEARGGTALHDALFASMMLADARNGRPLLLVFSDGVDQSSWLSEEAVIESARAADAVVYGIFTSAPQVDLAAAPRSNPGSRSWSRNVPTHSRPPLVRRRRAEAPHLLAKLTRDSGGRLWRAEAGKDLHAGFLGVLAEARARYVLRYEPRGVGEGGWHDVRVHLRRSKADVRTRRGYWRAAPELSAPTAPAP